MIKRDMESPTAFALRIKNECKIYDLQGLCQNRNRDYTIAVEAIDMGNDPIDAYVEMFSPQDIYAKTRLAERLNAVFVLLLHTAAEPNEIYLKSFHTDSALHTVTCTETKQLSEAYFLNWWKARQSWTQHKEYREEMQRKIAASYFDQLMEQNGSSWSGNIDGFMLKKNAIGEEDISAIIECRFSTNEDIRGYDPNKYFKSGGGDYVTWNGLLELSNRLSVPLYLFTYSRRIESRNQVGVAKIEGVDKKEGLVYSKGLAPCKNVKTTSIEVLDWIDKNS